MDMDFDVNKIINEFINSKIDLIISIGKSVFKNTKDNFSLHLRTTYADYLKKVYSVFQNTKSFYYFDDSNNLNDFYVPLDFIFKNQIIKVTSVSDFFEHSKNIIIIGSAGSGKTIFLKNLLINSINQKFKIPIFIELRNYDYDQISICGIISKVLDENGFCLDDEYVQKAFKAGHFLFLFDGFDEVNLNHRKNISSQIKEFSQKFSKNNFVLTSRPDDEFKGWQTFNEFKINKLDLKHAKLLINKLNYRKQIKSDFIKALTKEVFCRYETFCSNPLLLSLLFLTYSKGINFSTKISEYYNQAFIVLFKMHDDYKGALKREHNCNLNLSQFEDIFKSFCFLTYEQQLISFSELQAIEILIKCKKICSLEFNPVDFLKDLLQSVPLLKKDGLNITFTHKSFQEYFAAKFILNQKNDIASKILEKHLKKNILENQVLNLMYDINPEFIELNFILPKLNEICSIIKSDFLSEPDKYLLLVKEMFNEFELRKIGDQIVMIVHEGPRYHLFETIHFTFGKCYKYAHCNKLHELFTKFEKSQEITQELLDYYDEDKDGVALIFTKRIKLNDPFYNFIKTDESLSLIRIVCVLMIRINLLKKFENKAVETTIEDLLNIN